MTETVVATSLDDQSIQIRSTLSARQSGWMPWFALRTKSNFEGLASQILRQKGYEEFLPTYRRRTYWSDRIKTIDRPLFPGYLFCRFDERARLPILVTPGVVSVVGFGKAPVAIPDEEIEAVRTLLRSGLPARPWPFVSVGQRLVIERGPLCGIEGILLEIRNHCRFIVSVNLLQRSVAAEVEPDWVRPVGSHGHPSHRPYSNDETQLNDARGAHHGCVETPKSAVVPQCVKPQTAEDIQLGPHAITNG